MAKDTDLEQGVSNDTVAEREPGGSYDDAFRPNYTNATGGSTGGQPEPAADTGGEPANPDDNPPPAPAKGKKGDA